MMSPSQPKTFAPLAALFVLCVLPILAPPAAAQPSLGESWIDSPEAYFATAEERREWNQLTQQSERDAFKSRYWLKRDPTPGTAKNEFQEAVAERIRAADARFPIEKTPGSRTWRGFVTVVLGPPARIDRLISPAARQTPPLSPGSGHPGAVGAVDWNERTEIWIWDRDRTPRILDVLNRPSLEMRFLIEPNRRTDKLQNPGLMLEYRDRLAASTISNPQLVTATARVEVGESHAFDPLPGPLLPKTVRDALLTAPASTRSDEGVVFGSAVLWQQNQPLTHVWAFVPRETAAGLGGGNLWGVVLDPEGKDVLARLTKPFRPSSDFFATTPGLVVHGRLPLAPGTYRICLGVGEREGSSLIASGCSVVLVEEPDHFAVSSILVSGGASPVEPDRESTDFVLGSTRILPRADASFSSTESLWYFLQVRNPDAPQDAKVEVRLWKKGGQPGPPSTLPANLVEVGEDSFVTGFEIPLLTLDEGDYTLYATVRDGEESILRRADFRLIAR